MPIPRITLPDAARIAIGTVRETECSVVREVRFVLFGPAAFDHFKTRVDR